MKYKLVYFLISAVFLLPGLYFLLTYGLILSVDFTGGTLLEFSLQPEDKVSISIEEVKELVESQISVVSLQSTNTNTFLIRAPHFSSDENLKLKLALSEKFGQVEEKQFTSIGPTLGKELIKKTLLSISIAASFILLYVTVRFKDKKYGVCAILAMLHDTFILLGVFSFLGYFSGVEVDALFVTAVLTILSFSVHDTIVVYDRIRETLKDNPKLDFTDVVNKAVTETLGRSVNNSLTIIFMLLALFLLGGPTIKWFIFALLVGTISGTYSSTFTAAPLLLVWDKLFHKKT